MMIAKPFLWREHIKRYWVAIGVILVLVVVVALIIAGYWFDWTGFNGYNKVTITHTISGTNAGTVTRTEEYQPGKTLWDWMQLLIIPVVIAIGGFWLNQLQKSREEKHAAMLEVDKQREASLQAYLADMSKLLQQLRESAQDDKVRGTARMLTLTVLSRLDPKRKGSVLKFLYESGLIDDRNHLFSFSGADLGQADLGGRHLAYAHLNGALGGEADLREANLFRANLQGVHFGKADFSRAELWLANLSNADLGGAKFIGADLKGAKFIGANLSGADLTEADLSKPIPNNEELAHLNLQEADLSGADLSLANLSGAKVTQEQLKKAKSLQGAIMPNGSKHP
jgi:uncharacterized protein YjbI with pentapeptide repeats